MSILSFVSRVLKIVLQILIMVSVFVSVLALGLFVTARYHETPQVEKVVSYDAPSKTIWKIQSIDTMKQSRDLARGKAYDTAFDNEIAWQVKAIAETGANYIALGTPYDKEFLPFLRRWVRAARENHLNIWFRGNWSGWEGWFDYPKNLTRANHIKKTEDFIIKNSDIFEDGDIFSPCPECENGGTGDPRQTGDVVGYRRFITEEYQVAQAAFSQMNKKVQIFYPSNRDVAKLIMDKETTRSLGGFVIIDHHISDAQQIARDIEDMGKSSGGKVILGEFGIPSNDAQERTMTVADQAHWLKAVFEGLLGVRDLEGVNYWVNTTGSTQLWKENGDALPAVSIVKEYYSPNVVHGVVKDEYFCPVKNAKIRALDKEGITNESGYYEIRSIGDPIPSIFVSAPGYIGRNEVVDTTFQKLDVVLNRETSGSFLQKNWSFKRCSK